MSATTTRQDYTCPSCGGLGTTGEGGPTDRYASGDMQYRGYYPTNLCLQCNGAGVWGVPRDYVPEPVEAPAPVAAPAKPIVAAYADDDWEDPRDRI